jgi:hypothetical protein
MAAFFEAYMCFARHFCFGAWKRFMRNAMKEEKVREPPSFMCLAILRVLRCSA